MKNGNNSGQKLLNWFQKVIAILFSVIPAPDRSRWQAAAGIHLINLWQKIFSPDHSWRKIYYPYGACRYYPTCSEYSKICLAEWGIKGLWPSIKRIARCHPWSAGGLDLPPKNTSL